MRIERSKIAAPDATARSPRLTALLVTTALTALAGGQAFAQTPPPAAAPVATAPSDALTEVVVTAERRAVNLQTTSIAMSALSAQDLDKKAVRNVHELQYAAPALSITDNGLTASVNIRGVGLTVSDPAISGGVAIIRDGLFQPESIQQADSFYDINDIEVLRGPQGTFVGQNSTGGAILINSKSPTLGDVSGNVMAQFGNYSDKKVTAAVNLPINSTMAARIAFNYENRNSFYLNLGGNSVTNKPMSILSQPGTLDTKQIRVSYLWKPTEDFQLLIKNEYGNIDNGGFTGKPIPNSRYYRFAPLDPFTLNYDFNEQEKEWSNRLGIEMKYQFKGLQLRSMSGYQWMDVHNEQDVDATNVNGSYTHHEVGPDNHYWSQQFDLGTASPDERFTWIIGYSYFFRKTPVHLIQPNNDFPFSPANPLIVDVNFGSALRSQGVFAQAGFKLNDQWQIVVGGRESFDTQHGFGRIIVGGNTISKVGDYKVNTPTGKITLNWTPTPGQFFYVFAARGYKPGGVNDITSNFAAEHVNDYEIGWKSTLADGHLRTQVGAYYMDYSDLQYTVLSPVTGRNSIQNIASATIKGAEASVQGRFGGLSIDGSVAYVHSAIQGITLIQPNLLPDGGQGTLGFGCSATVTTNCFNYGPFVRNINGAQNTNSPEWSFNVGVAYSIPIGHGSLTPRVDYSYVGSQWTQVFQKPTDVDASFLQSKGLWAATLAYDSGPWTLEAYGRNIGNKVYISGKIGTTQFYGAPEQYGVRASRSF